VPGLRSIFIGLYPFFLVVSSFHAAQMLYGEAEGPLAWWGVLLTTAPFMVLLLRVMIFKDLARTSRRLPVIQGLAIVGFFLAFFSFLVIGAPDPLALGLAAAGLALFSIYNFWYSELGPLQSTTLIKGSRLTEFTLEDLAGETVSAEDLSAGPTFILFYRGNWCPFCMGQIREITAHYEELENLGVSVALVSPQPQHKTAKLAAKHGINFRFLIDQDNRAARALGIDLKSGVPVGLSLFGYAIETVLPTIVLVGADGRILFTERSDNYRVRPHPKHLIGILKDSMAA
jgi:peroxiredoxin